MVKPWVPTKRRVPRGGVGMGLAVTRPLEGWRGTAAAATDDQLFLGCLEPSLDRDFKLGDGGSGGIAEGRAGLEIGHVGDPAPILLRPEHVHRAAVHGASSKPRPNSRIISRNGRS
jgi:hypothetical protein